MSDEEQRLLNEFQAKYPACSAQLSQSFSGWVSDRSGMSVSSNTVYVTDHVRGITVSGSHPMLEKALMMAELELQPDDVSGGRHYYNRDLLTGFLPEGLRNDGWRCTRSWWEHLGSGRDKLYHIKLSRNGYPPIEFDNHDFWAIFDLAIQEAGTAKPYPDDV